MRVICSLLLLIAAASPILRATSYTATTSGHWNSNATWGGGGHPGTGDTWLIPSGLTVTLDSSDGSVNTGTVASTCSLDGVIGRGGTLTIASGGTLTQAGSIRVAGGGTLNLNAVTANATLALKPAAGTACFLNVNWGGAGYSHLNFTGASNSIMAVFQGDLSGGGRYVYFSTFAPAAQFNWSYAKIDTCGNATNPCAAALPTSGAQSFDHVLIVNSGSFDLLGPANGTDNLIFTHVSFVNPRGDSAGSVRDSTAATTAVRYANNLTCYVDTGARPASYPASFSWAVNASKACGASTAEGDSGDVSCYQFYNCWFVISSQNAADTAGQTVREGWSVLDSPTNSGYTTAINTQVANNQRVQDSIIYGHVDNAYWINNYQPSGSAANQYSNNIFDGDYWVPGDAGEDLVDRGNHIFSYNLSLYGSGVLDNTQLQVDVEHNTAYQDFSENLGESTPGQIHPLIVKNNLFVFPLDPTGGYEGEYQSGVDAQSSWQEQDTVWTLNYNGYYGMPGSGDASEGGVTPTGCGNAISCPLPNVADGTDHAYLLPPFTWVSGLLACVTAAGTSPTTVIFTTCSTALIHPGQFLVDSVSGKPVQVIASVTGGNSLTLQPPGISGLTAGHVVSVFLSYWSSRACPQGCVYGTTSGIGTQDIHASPHFFDSRRGNCAYYVSILYGSAICRWLPSYDSAALLAGKFLATSGTTNTTINDANTNFLTLGATTADWLIVFVGDTRNFRCKVQVSSVSANQVGISPACPGLAAGDAFTFDTAVNGLGKAIVTLNGWDYQGNPITPVPNANTARAWSWIRAGFRPQNLIYKNAGDDGRDIGAIPVIPSRPPGR